MKEPLAMTPITKQSLSLLTIEEAADLLKVSTKTMRRRIDDGSIRAVRHGRFIRVRADDLNAYLLAHIKFG